MLGIVEGVDHVVRRARVVRLALEEVGDDGAGLHLPVEARLAASDESEVGKRVERLGLVVLGMRLGEPPHGLVVELVALVLVTGAVEDLDGVHVEALALGRGLGPAFGAGGPEALQDVPGGADVLLRPQRMVVADRLAPVGEGEVRIDLLGVLEGFSGFLVPEAVERRDTALEGVLSRLRAGVREMHGAEIGLFFGNGGHRDECEGGDGQNDFLEHETLRLGGAVCARKGRFYPSGRGAVRTPLGVVGAPNRSVAESGRSWRQRRENWRWPYLVNRRPKTAMSTVIRRT